MAFLHRLRLFPQRYHRSLSILSPDNTPLSSKDKTRSAIALLKLEKNPERIIDICRAASLTPESHLDRVAFSIAISKLSDSKYFDGIRRLLDEELKSPDNLRNECFSSHAIILYGQANMLEHAIRTFKEIEDYGIRRSVKSLNALLFACILAKDYKEAKRVYVDFPRIYNIEPDLDTYNTVLKAFSQSGSTSSVYSVLDEMNRKGVKPNATSFGTVLAGFYKEEKFEDVEKVLKLMEEQRVRPGLGVNNIRIQSLCKLKRSSEAKALFDEMLSRGTKPNSVTYWHLIQGFCKERNFEEAKELFKNMGYRGCKPSGDCYFTLVHFLCQEGDFETALRICKESMAKGWVPNITTMQTLVKGLAKISKVKEAREIVAQVKEKFARNERWNEIEAGLTE